MADVLQDNQVAPSTPAASKSVLYVDNSTKKFMQMNDSGVVSGVLATNSPASGAASVALAVTETYIAGSALLLPTTGMQVGMMWRWYLAVVKTAAGVATPIFKIYFGTNASTADTAELTLTGSVQAASASGGILIVSAICRTAGASAVLVGNFTVPAPGFGTGQTTTAVSGAFNGSPGGTQYVGISVTPGASAAWTLDGVRAELIG